MGTPKAIQNKGLRPAVKGRTKKCVCGHVQHISKIAKQGCANCGRVL